MNYADTLITLVADDGDEYDLSAYKIKALQGNAKRTIVYAELEGRQMAFTVRRAIAEVREEWRARLRAGDE